MTPSSTELPPGTVDPRGRRRRNRTLLVFMLLIAAIGFASGAGLNATERKLVGVWEGIGIATGMRFRFDSDRRYRIESSDGSVDFAAQEGEWTMREGKLRLFEDRRIPQAFFPRLAWRISQTFTPRGGMTGALEFQDDRSFRSSILCGGTWQRVQ